MSRQWAGDQWKRGGTGSAVLTVVTHECVDSKRTVTTTEELLTVFYSDNKEDDEERF